MSYQIQNDLIDELEEERIIREYEEECANEEVVDVRRLDLCRLDESSIQKSRLKNDKFDKCLNISDNEYLENLSQLDNESERSLSTNNKPLYINTSIPPFAIDNLNFLLSRAAAQRSLNKYKELDKFKELNSSNSTINSSQLNDPLNDDFKSNNNSSTDNLLNCSSNDLSNGLTNGLSNDISNELSSSNDNLRIPSPEHNFKRIKKKSVITFEVISARRVHSSEYVNNNTNKPFVLYTIIIKRVPGLETQPGIIEKRYSDFLKFFLVLRKTFAVLFENFPFPKKIYSNNFETDVIAERSIVFQHLLTYCLSIQLLRTSPAFFEFILHSEFKKSRRLLRSRNFEEAVICLENQLYILCKLNQNQILTGQGSQMESTKYLEQNIFITYLALAACLNEMENYKDSAHYAQEAFKMITFSNDFDTNELIIPFLLLSVQLNSRLNRCCKAQNQKLLDLSDNQIFYERIKRSECLIELFVLKNYFIFDPSL